jgi:hypothetical protein
MPKKCDCPDTLVYDRGTITVKAVRPTRQAALNAMRAQLPFAKTLAEKAQTDAYRAALLVGDAACKPGKAGEKCTALFWGPPLWGPGETVGPLPPKNKVWLARGDYRWKVMVECELPKPLKLPIIECLFAVVAEGIEAEVLLEPLRQFRDERMTKSPAGRRYLTLYDKHNDEIVALLFKQQDLLALAQAILPKLVEYVPTTKAAEERPVDPKLIEEIDQALGQLSAKASADLQNEIKKLRLDLQCFSGVSITDGLSRIPS